MFKNESARGKRAQLLGVIVKYANLWRSCCRCRSGCLGSLLSHYTEFKKVRRLLQRKRYIKIELCLSVGRFLHVGHVVRNRRSLLSLAWHEWSVSCKGGEWKIYRCGLALSSEPQIGNWNFTLSFGRLRQKIATKRVPQVQQDYFSSFNQSNHWFVALSWSLRSSFLRLPYVTWMAEKSTFFTSYTSNIS